MISLVLSCQCHVNGEEKKGVGYIIRVSAVEELGLTVSKAKRKQLACFYNMSSIFTLEKIDIVFNTVSSRRREDHCCCYSTYVPTEER